MLSEKARGKQRAVEVAIGSDGEEMATEVRNLVVRFSEGIPDLIIPLRQGQKVGEIKKLVRELRPQLQRRRLRLILAGRLLTEEVLYDVLVSLEKKRQAMKDDTDEQGKAKTVVGQHVDWIHCSVGPAFEPGEEEEEEEDKAQAMQLHPLRGFDRLSAAGFSDADIANFRRTFHNQSSANYLDDNDFATEEEYSDHARALEEQWIDSLDDSLSASMSQSSFTGSSSILEGIVFGFFFPMIPFFFMREPKPAIFWEGGEWEGTRSVVFSKRMQMGLVLGFFINLLFGLWRYLLDSSF